MVDITLESEIDEPDIRGHPRTSTNHGLRVDQHERGVGDHPAPTPVSTTAEDRVPELPRLGLGRRTHTAATTDLTGADEKRLATDKDTPASHDITSASSALEDDEPKPIGRRATFGGVPSRRTTGRDGAGAAGPSGLVAAGGLLFDPVRPRPQALGQLLVPDRKLAADPTWTTSFKNIMKSSYFVWLLPFIPVCWALHLTHQQDLVVCIFSFIAVLPLASLLSFATEQLALRVGDALGGLLNATFGNAVELLISILALTKGEIGLVQASMVGSILSNTLLVLGMCYFAGGLRFHEQMYTVASSQVQISLLGLSIAAIVLPAGYHYAVIALDASPATLDLEERHILQISRGLSFILLSVYAMYLVFILYTHAYLFKLPRAGRPHHEPGQPHPNHTKVFPRPQWLPSLTTRRGSTSTNSLSTIASALGRTRTTEEGQVVPVISTTTEDSIDSDDDDERHTPQVKSMAAVALLLITTGLAGYTAEVLLDSIDGLTEQGGVSKEFVGLILLPLVGNSVEHVAAVTVSVKDKLDLSMAIAIGSSIQVSLCLLPILVLVGWAIGQPMSLYFDNFETITLAVSLLLVNFAISDGRTQYLEGYILMISYVMIALVCWFYDPVSTSTIVG